MASFTLDQAIQAAVDRGNDLMEVVNKTGVYIRDEPDKNGKALGRKLFGDIVHIVDVRDNWAELAPFEIKTV